MTSPRTLVRRLQVADRGYGRLPVPRELLDVLQWGRGTGLEVVLREGGLLYRAANGGRGARVRVLGAAPKRSALLPVPFAVRDALRWGASERLRFELLPGPALLVHRPRSHISDAARCATRCGCGGRHSCIVRPLGHAGPHDWIGACPWGRSESAVV